MQKYANIVEFENCCQTHVFLQNFVLIQPRTSPPRICKILPISLTLSLTLLDSGGRRGLRRLLLAARAPGLLGQRVHRDGRVLGRVRSEKFCRNYWQISAKFLSFSAVSAPIFASKYAFFSIFQNLQDYLAAIFEIRQILQILQHLQNFADFSRKLLIFRTEFLLL